MAFAVQLGTVRALGRFLDDPLDVPACAGDRRGEVLDAIALVEELVPEEDGAADTTMRIEQRVEWEAEVRSLYRDGMVRDP